LTSVDYRIKLREERLIELDKVSNGEKDIELKPSDEEAIALIEAILGKHQKISNVNMINKGQVRDLPLGAIVETNALFTNDQVTPLLAKKLPALPLGLVKRNSDNIDLLYEGIKNRDLNQIFEAFHNQPLLDSITKKEALNLFIDMINNTRNYLDSYFNIDDFIKEH